MDRFWSWDRGSARSGAGLALRKRVVAGHEEDPREPRFTFRHVGQHRFGAWDLGTLAGLAVSEHFSSEFEKVRGSSRVLYVPFVPSLSKYIAIT
jgi:hypothetical protein